MRRKIHTILAIAAAAVLCTGCADKAGQRPGGDTPWHTIGFSCSELKSRTQEATAANMTSFRVSAVWTKAPGDYADNLMVGQAVEKNGSGAWVYSPVRNMPSYGTVDFFAYSPANAAVSNFKIDGDKHDQVTLVYDVTTDPGAQYDFMVAEALEETSSSILLEFRHVLSAIRVEARSISPGYTFRVSEVKLHNMFRQGTLKSNTSATSPKTTSWEWSGQMTPATYVIEQDGAVDVSDTNAYTEISDASAGPLMILPQTVSKGKAHILVTDTDVTNGTHPAWMLGLPKDLETSFYVIVTYDVLNSSDDSTVEKNITKYIPLGDPDDLAKLFTFELGGKYALNIDLEYP